MLMGAVTEVAVAGLPEQGHVKLKPDLPGLHG